MHIAQIQRVQELAINVQLQLIVGGVADADWTRAAMSLEMAECLLGQCSPSVDAIEALQLARILRLLASFDDPTRERLRAQPEPNECVRGERRVTNPRIAKIPIPRAPDLLGETERRRGDDRAGPTALEQFEGQRRPPHRAAPLATIRATRNPPSPEDDRAPQRPLCPA